MGKKKVISEEVLNEMVLPTENDVLGATVTLLGFDRVLVKCQDCNERLYRIRGKMKRRVWIREGDIVLVSTWDFKPTEEETYFGDTSVLKLNGFAEKVTSPSNYVNGELLSVFSEAR